MAVPRGALALIPARGGSKGIPGKNLQKVGGVPLVCRSIHAAQASNSVGRVVVSTDDAAIAAAAEGEGAGVVILPWLCHLHEDLFLLHPAPAGTFRLGHAKAGDPTDLISILFH